MIGLFLGLALASANAVAPSCDILPGWKQDGASRLYEGENLFEYMDGNSEGYLIYGFVLMRGITCTKGNEKVLIDISEMKDDESAYGLFSSNRDVKNAVEKIGANGQVVPRKAIFVKGNYFVEIAAEDQGDHTEMLRAAAKAVESRVPGSTAAPEQIGWFPSEGLTAGPPRLVPESVLGVRVLKRGYMAQYGPVKAFIVTEASKEAVLEVVKKWFGRYDTISEAGIPRDQADEAYVVEDKYLGRIVAARLGSRLIGCASTSPGADPVAMTRSVLAKVPR